MLNLAENFSKQIVLGKNSLNAGVISLWKIRTMDPNYIMFLERLLELRKVSKVTLIEIAI